MRSHAATVDEYFETLPDDRREALERLRALIASVTPGVDETMQSGMAAFAPGNTPGDPIFALASQKHYMALYVLDADILQEHGDQLGTRDFGQSCIRFRKLDDLNLEVIETVMRLSVARRTMGDESEIPSKVWRDTATAARNPFPRNGGTTKGGRRRG